MGSSSEDGSHINGKDFHPPIPLLGPDSRPRQLCALSTVGIATSGLALGRVERSKPSIFRRKTFSYNQPPPTPSELPTPVDARPKTAWRARPPTAGADWTTPTEKAIDGHDGLCRDPLQDPDLRRAPLSFSAARRRRRGQTLTNPPLRIPENETPESIESRESHSRRPSTSWLRRLSIVSFQTESPSTNSPVTPSFNGSASPILPRPSSSRRAPNKLVKRSSSQHSNANPLFFNTSVSPVSALRRPATSHQRSESIGPQSPLAMDFGPHFPESYPIESPMMEEFAISPQNNWRPYLLPKSEGFSEKLARRLSTTASPKPPGVRRIISEQDTLPALVLATTITPQTSTPREDQSVPVTPITFCNPFQTDTDVAAAAPLPPPAPEAPALEGPPPEKPMHKHSFSLNDVEPKKIIVNTVTASGTPIPGRARAGSLKRVKGRTFSIPRSELAKLHSVIPSSPQAPQRRNITDPSVFRRPQALSPPGLAVSAYGRDHLMAPRSVSQDYNVGIRGQHPLTSDAVALSTWQHSARPDSYTISSLRRRPKRHSIAASDPSSTVIGSDDTRVFTSSDEYETDIMTDYWDSLRTHETSGGGLKGLHIETMFEKAGAHLSNEEVATLEELLPRGSFALRLEQDPPLFPDSLLPSVAQARLDDTTSIPEGDAETGGMIGALPGESDGAPLRSALAVSVSSASVGHGGSSFAMPRAGSPVAQLHMSQKMNIFDWSEQSRPDRDMSDSEARPRTMQGKQSVVNRGSRAACRKVPSAIHLRSQSVPVARDLPANESRQPSGKFGTWGLGTKGVSEDWDSDFDFDDTEEPAASQDTKSTESEAAPQSMMVPKAILERQASLRGQFGQVQELTLLVEELKRLRHQASILDLVSGPSSELWKEAEGIVNLATIDDDDDRRSPPGSPSSLTFSFDDSDDEGANGASKRNSDASWQSNLQQDRPLQTAPSRQPKKNTDGGSWQGSPQHEPRLYNSTLGQLSKVSPKSKSVLDILQPSRHTEGSGLSDLTPPPRTQKLPFDTQSLRDLVVRAGVVTRALKEVIRKAEGVDPSPQNVFPSDPPFRRIFDQPSHDDLAGFEAALAEMH
ncbi:uncharacterized protein N7482_002298 [Penicillium canariense]|uniref:Uncharacterized protein n=1 Tax=Penicillium canariense TaxID=189055 RepID=A0A9W9LTW1_9EURO|nr:uncharacterized protein N7482_002298 [Penicillium canariense]KAJ5176421.1 hypothetical protein N7482_002298 [Penicillium canariense]